MVSAWAQKWVLTYDPASEETAGHATRERYVIKCSRRLDMLAGALTIARMALALAPSAVKRRDIVGFV